MGNTYEAIRIDFDNVVTYTETDQNVVGAGTTTTLRTIVTHDDTNCIYVAKTGDDSDAGTQANPVLTIGQAETLCVSPKVTVTVLDSGVYDEEITIDNADCDTVQADLGQAPTVKRGVGARTSSTPVATTGTVYYINKAGDDANTGLSEAQAFLTVQQGLDSVASGDSVEVTDSGIYTEDLAFPVNMSVRLIAQEGQTPTIECSDNTVGISLPNVPPTTGKIFYIDGFIISYSGTGDAILATTGGGVANCEIFVYNCTVRVSAATGSGIHFDGGGFVDSAIVRCHIYAPVTSSGYGIEAENGLPVLAIDDCIVHGFSTTPGAGIHVHPTGVASTINIRDCIVYNCFNCYLITHDSATDDTTITNCLAFSVGNICYLITRFAGDTFTVTGSIAFKNTAIPGTEDFNFSSATTITYCLYSYADSTNATAGAGTIDGVPTFCDIDNGFYGLKPETNGWHVGNAPGGIDMGPRWNVFTLLQGTITFNGLRIEGNNQWFKGIAHGTGQTQNVIEWCSVGQFGGAAVDFYNTGIASCQFLNSTAHHSGAGVVGYGSTSVFYSIAYKNKTYGFYSDSAGEAIDHSIFYGNGDGAYFDDDATALYFKNCITAQNAAYGIFSVTSTIIVTYSDIADAYNTNVNVTSITNLFFAPYFRNVLDNQEDFHLATVEGGFIFPEGENNLLIGAGESDIGAWIVVRVEASNVWDTYTLPDNPVRVDFQRIPINLQERFDTSGVYRRNADAFQWNITFTWPDDYGLDQDLPRIMEYLFQKDTEIRIYFAAAAGLWQGNVTLDLENKRLTPDGYPTLIPDQWKSYWFVIDGTTTPFKITGNTRTYWQLADPDGELPAAGVYAAVITFIRVKNRARTAVAPVQKYYLKDENGLEVPRNGFKIAFIEY